MPKMTQYKQEQSSIMEPFEPHFKQEVCFDRDFGAASDLRSIPFLAPEPVEDSPINGCFHFMDANENMLIPTAEKFTQKLQCSDSEKIKVVSIFGNTGDGKSHTMNNTFFSGKSTFKTSDQQTSCTVGVYGAMQHTLGVLCLDTEGLLGTGTNNDQTMRMLLKVLAISDIIIYRTRSERLHRDMYDFLRTASKAFCDYFAQALQSLAIPGTAKTLGPAVIIFHETHRTKPLQNSVAESAEDQLRKNFDALGYEINAFSSLRYVGVQTANNKSTDFSKLLNIITTEIENTTVRSPRRPSVVFKALKALNLKFSSKIVDKHINPFPEQYFSCPIHCESCSRRCQLSMGHANEDHKNSHPCNYQQQFENKVFLCKSCYNNGKEIIVKERIQTQNESSWNGLAKYLWNGSVIDCPQCGEIYRARKYWYGNEAPEANAVRTEIVHVWKDSNRIAKGNSYSAQVVIDSVSSITETISNISSPPTKALSNWLADCIAPNYWRPNHEIIVCFACKKHFEKTGLPKHHCRGCGEGFCNSCSLHKMPVPSRGWNEPVRVCNQCREKLSLHQDPSEVETSTEAINHTNSNNNTGNQGDEEPDVFVRKYGETVYNTLTTVASVALQYPKEIIKDKARPDYWVPDAESPCCFICKILFGTAESLAMLNDHANDSTEKLKQIKGDNYRHHCRRCGQAVCNNCSRKRQPVPERGWPTLVRICDACASIESDSPSCSSPTPNHTNTTKNKTKTNTNNISPNRNNCHHHHSNNQKLVHSDFEEFKAKNE